MNTKNPDSTGALGFTLLELVLAIAILTLIGAVAYRMLHSTILASERMHSRPASITTLLDTYWQLRADLHGQITPLQRSEEEFSDVTRHLSMSSARRLSSLQYSAHEVTYRDGMSSTGLSDQPNLLRLLTSTEGLGSEQEQV
ncbi:MAG: prepilin-type N-terminal cleavage/methylation domain-containing protein, partial [Verrucomicrobiota bacterium]